MINLLKLHLILLSGIAATIVTLHFGVNWRTPFALAFTWSLFVLATIDWKYGVLPDQITITFIWIGLLVNLGNWFCDSREAIIGAVVGYVSLWLLAWSYQKITKTEGMGHGDFKLFAMLGAWLGWQPLLFVLMIASLSGSVVGISLSGFNKLCRRTSLAFGPHLALSGWIALLLEKKWLQWWLC